MASGTCSAAIWIVGDSGDISREQCDWLMATCTVCDLLMASGMRLVGAAVSEFHGGAIGVAAVYPPTLGGTRRLREKM